MNTNNDKNELIIGILLFAPMYMLFFELLYHLNLRTSNNTALFPILLYFPIVSGVMLSYLKYGSRMSKLAGFITILFCIIGYYYYFNTYFVEHEGWDGIGYYLAWAINTVICRIFSFIFYIRVAGLKKASLALLIYIMILICSIAFGFWS